MEGSYLSSGIQQAQVIFELHEKFMSTVVAKAKVNIESVN